MPTPPHDKLSTMSDEEVAERYDLSARQTGAGGVNFWREELARRDQAKHERVILGLTKRMYWLAVVSVLASLVSLGALVASLTDGIPSESPGPTHGTTITVPSLPEPVPVDPDASPLPAP